MADEIPSGFSYNTQEQKARLQEAAQNILASLEGTGIGAMACVFAMPDGTVTAAIGGENITAMAAILASGPEVLRITVERMKEGKGETKILVGTTL